jgi:xanthine dehydrogenase accessory factor
VDPLLLKRLNAERRSRRAAVLVTDLTDGRDRLVRESEAPAGELGAAIAKSLRNGKSGIVEADGRRFFLNVHLPHPRLVIIGAVHISQALAPMAAIAGFDVEIIDPRTAFATPERFDNVALSAEWPQDALAERPLDRFTALAAVTHDPKIDDYPIKAALEAGCFYVGALGSRKTHSRRVERLEAEGLSKTALSSIAAPIGLDIGAASPAEIAVATLAQIIGALRKRALVAPQPQEAAPA